MENLIIPYQLEKNIWTDADFEQMGWHDNAIYKIALGKELEMDIDYIFKWNTPEIPRLPFSFWIAPATLVFKEISQMQLNFDIVSTEGELEIEGIIRGKDNDDWSIITRQGTMLFKAKGYEQFIRQEPFFQYWQRIPQPERYGTSLERTTCQDNPNRHRQDIIEQCEQEHVLYNRAKNRLIAKNELELLIRHRDNNQISLKDFLLQKRIINEQLSSYNDLLKGTLFEYWG